MGLNELGLPLGLQVIGALYRDLRVLEIAASYEAAAGLDDLTSSSALPRE